MPIYEYECTECGKVEEAIQKISEPPLEQCKHCNGKLHKLISQSSFHLKGSGWYVTDYGGSASKGAASNTKEESAKSTTASACKAKKTDTASAKND